MRLDFAFRSSESHHDFRKMACRIYFSLAVDEDTLARASVVRHDF